MGKGIDSAQFLFDSNTLAYSQNEYIHLDHDQRITGSFGASYTWKEKRGSTRIYIDAIYGSGLRADEVSSTGEVIVPNGVNLEPYYSINMGVEEIIQTPTKHRWKLRLDVLNITDDVYELRNGTGVGVNAPQYGMRLGFYGSLGYAF
jgi:outer membrane receptor protein involved in Fe transport